MQTEKSLKGWIIAFSFGVLILLSIPFIIEYGIDHNLITAAVALTYWGSIIGASVAIVGVFLTLRHNREMLRQQNEENRIRTQQMYDENQKNLLIDRSMEVFPYISFYKLRIMDIAKYSNLLQRI